MLLEAEIKRQFDEVARVKAGPLTYIIKMLRTEMTIDLEDGGRKEIVAVTPDIAISLLSSVNRTIRKEEPDQNLSYPRRKVREVFSNTYNRSYQKLSDEDSKKINSFKLINDIVKVLEDYLKKYNINYILANPYKDGKEGRLKLYGTILNKMGFRKVYSYRESKGDLYSKNPDKVLGIIDTRIYRKGKMTDKNAIKNSIRIFRSNL